MTCSDVERVLPEFLEAPEGGFQTAFEAHIKSCQACSDLISDLKLIAKEARQMSATEEPAPRVWVRIAAELRAEGLIHELNEVPGRPVLVSSRERRRWSRWWLAPVAAALVAAGSYVVSHKPVPQLARKDSPGTPMAEPAVTAPIAPTPIEAANPAPTVAPPVQESRASVKPSAKDLDAGSEAASNAEDQQFLSVVSTLSPSARTTYENQLQVVNADIQETQSYVDRNPGDTDARQHLMDAYQQKALLYQIALDRIQ